MMPTLNRTSVRKVVVFRPRTEVNLRDIISVDGDSNYCIVRLIGGQQISVAISLHQMGDRLPELVRIHKQQLINLEFVEVVFKRQNLLRLTTGEVRPVAKRRKSQVRELYNQFRHAG